MTTEQRLMHDIVAEAIASCRVPVPRESSRARSEFNGVLADALEVGLPVAREQLGAVARAQRAEDALIDAREDARLFCEQRDKYREQLDQARHERDEALTRVQELEAEVDELRQQLNKGEKS